MISPFDFSSLVSQRTRAGSRRGFTLVELMVAMAGGIVFTVFVLMLSRDVSRFFQNEARSADATMSAITGFQRLRQDVARAGYLSSPNYAKDPNRCPARVPGSSASGITSASFPQLIEYMAVARVDVGGSLAMNSANTFLALNAGLNPDALYLWGNYSGADQYSVRSVSTGRVYLDPTSSALLSAGYDPALSSGELALVVADVFPAGRILRIYDPDSNEEQYVILGAAPADPADPPTHVDTSDVNAPFLSLNSLVPLEFHSANGVCGIRGVCRKCLINVVNVIRYRLADLSSDTNYAQLYDASVSIGINSGRLELIREELDPTLDYNDASQPMAGTTELVAEFAVDFKVGLTVESTPPGGEANAALRSLVFIPDDGSTASSGETISNFAGDLTTGIPTANYLGPQAIRAISVRMGVRTRTPDRTGSTGPVISANPTAYRVMLRSNTAPTPNEYARVRTLRASIATRNTRDKRWN